MTDLNKLHDLAVLLRNPSQWPEGFVWDYWHHRQCALGLASIVYGPEFVGTIRKEAQMFPANHNPYWNIFYAGVGIGGRVLEPTPLDVAQAIDQFLETR